MKTTWATAALLLSACATTPPPTTPAEATAPAATPIAADPLSPVIPMVSAPLDTSQTVSRILFGSCLKQQDDQAIWTQLAKADPDLFLFIGDNVYGDVWDRDPMLPELRQAYYDLAQSKPFAALRQSTPTMVVWDDHDYGLNDAGGSFSLKYGAEALFEEAWALPADDPRRARDGVYHAEIIGAPGQQVQVIMLDTRFFRSDLTPTDEKNAPGKERYLPDLDAAKTMLGEAQYEWLLAELAKPADLRLIVSSIQVIADGHGWEAWRTLPLERQRLYDVISSSGAEQVILLSGDRHAGAFYKTDDALAYPLYELTSSSLNAPAAIWRAQSGETRIEDGPHRLGTMEFDVNYGQIDIDWNSKTVSLALKGADGSTLQQQDIRFSNLMFSD